MKKPIGSFNSSEYSYHRNFYCGLCGENIPIKVSQYCSENYCTPKQVTRMLRQGRLLGLKFKGIMYVSENPNWEDG